MKRFELAILIVLLLLIFGCSTRSNPVTTTATSLTATPMTPSPTGTGGFIPWGPWDSIVSAAKQEGKLMVYVAPGHATPATQQAWDQIFREKFGIAIEWVGSSEENTISRILMEQKNKTYVADVLLNGWGAIGDVMGPQGYLQPILAPASLEKDIWRIDPAMMSPRDRNWLYLFIPLSPALVVNTNLVKPGEEPQSYQDLLDPKWKGKITMMTPAVGGSGFGWFVATYRTLGQDYLKKLAQQVVLQGNTGQEVQAVARGQFAIAVGPSVSGSRSLIKAGSPIKYVHMQEGDYSATQGIYMVSNAPHSNAAKVFINWIYTQEGQNFYAKSQEVVSIRKDVPQDWVPPDLRFDPAHPPLLFSPEEAVKGRPTELTTLGKQIFEDLK